MEIALEIIALAVKLKQLRDDFQGHKLSCRQLVDRCISLEIPVQKLMNENQLHLAKEINLKSLLQLFQACYEYCDKFTGSHWI